MVGSQWICLFFGSTGWLPLIYLLEHSAVICLAVGAWVGVVRYRLFDVRFVVNRALLYAALTAVVVLTYIAVFGAVQQVAGGFAPSLVAVIVSALIALPLRDVFQRQANRLVYGHRQDPYAAFAHLGEQLGAAITPGAALPRVVGTIASALRLRYVAVEAGDRTLAVAGSAGDGAEIEVALHFEGETVGRLTVQTGSAGERLSPTEMRLVAGLAPQVAAATRAMLLTEALQQSRERIVALREEERRRIRRDLHDGLGPTLAGIVLGLDRARAQLDRDVEAAARTLDALVEHAGSAVVDIRRLVHELRPPTLDELGLTGASREEASRFDAAEVDAADDLPALPAAVEVAVYRIAQEAMTNANRHGRAGSILLRLRVGHEAVELEVSDDGVGISDGYRAGIGIESMRERASELGGLCTVDRRLPHGTLVRALLPLAVRTPE